MSALLRVSRLMLTSSFLQGAVAPAALRVHSTAQQRCVCVCDSRAALSHPSHAAHSPHTACTRHASTAAKPKAEVVSKSDLVDMVTEKLGALGRSRRGQACVARR